MVKELSVEEQKYAAVMAVLSDGRSVSEVAQAWGTSRQSIHAWLRQYEQGGLAGLAPRSTRPVSCPHQMPGVVEAGAGDAADASGLGTAADPLRTHQST